MSNTINTMLRLTIGGIHYLNYKAVIQSFGLSQHHRQLARRKTKYPQHFKNYDGDVYISLQYVQTLQQYYQASNKINNLKTKGGSNGSN